MSNPAQLTSEALALPLPDRVRLAQALWSSLQPSSDSTSAKYDAEVAILAELRDTELEHGSVEGLPHEDVMQQARKSLRCE